jgi:hypothetical protein
MTGRQSGKSPASSSPYPCHFFPLCNYMCHSVPNRTLLILGFTNINDTSINAFVTNYSIVVPDKSDLLLVHDFKLTFKC